MVGKLGQTHRRAQSILLRMALVVGVLAAWWPAGTVSARFFPLVRRSIQLGMLPRHSASALFFDSCATLRMNRMPEFCERIYKLRTPDPDLSTTYPEQITQSGWELVNHRTAKSYDGHVRRVITLDCFVFRTWLWGINEMLIVAILDQRVIFLAASNNTGYCSRLMRM
jgi:hypothetical protein